MMMRAVTSQIRGSRRSPIVGFASPLIILMKLRLLSGCSMSRDKKNYCLKSYEVCYLKVCADFPPISCSQPSSPTSSNMPSPSASRKTVAFAGWHPSSVRSSPASSSSSATSITITRFSVTCTSGHATISPQSRPWSSKCLIPMAFSRTCPCMPYSSLR